MKNPGSPLRQWRPISILLILGSANIISANPVKTSVDEMTRYIHISYAVPKDAPEEILVRCEWSPAGRQEWQKAKVTPLVSETGMVLMSTEDWKQGMEGKIVERRAAGLERTVVFNPYPEAQTDGKVDADFRILLEDKDGKKLAEFQTHLQADNRDVVYIEDWSGVMQKEQIVTGRRAEAAERKWSYETNLDAAGGSTFGNQLFGQSPADIQLTSLTYPLDLKGTYAIYIQGEGSLDFRLTGDEQSDRLGSLRPGQERLWKWAKMNRQHLVIGQGNDYTGFKPGSMDYVKLVPLTEAKVKDLNAAKEGKKDKLLVFYWEPYSWAFHYGCRQPLDHRKAMLGYKLGEVDLLDMQIGRFGMKGVYESRIIDQLLFETHGDPIGTVKTPLTNNVGMMQQYTNVLDASVRYCREFGIPLFANFGISNCYKGTDLQGQFSKDHPDWMRGSRLRFEVPEVRQFALSAFQECLEIGAENLSVDMCRYPNAFGTAQTGNVFMKEVRELANAWESQTGKPVSIMIRFPAYGHEDAELFDYATWVQNGWVDYLMPSNLADRFFTYDLKPYLDAVKGTTCKLTPSAGYNPCHPGLLLWRVRQMYQQGADGMYSYHGSPGTPDVVRLMPLLSRTEAIDRWWQRDAAQRPACSKGIYITTFYGWRKYWKQQRIRVWLEGIPMGAVEMYLDDKLITRCDGAPYTLGTEGHESDTLIPEGEHRLRIRARDGDGWLEQTFVIPDTGERGEWKL